ncbi:ribose 5-phosphate isomerase B [bacterium]|nr:ribose 5-phosphate isomerase B [bacterium]
MNIALASDHAGYELKKDILAHLNRKKIPCKDFGCGPGVKVDYVDYAHAAAKEVVAGNFDRAILICATGLGMAIAANKHPGIRATPCYNEYVTEMSRKHNHSNCLTLGGRVISSPQALALVDIWLETPFERGRHQRRIDKIKQIEKKHFKSPR